MSGLLCEVHYALMAERVFGKDVMDQVPSLGRSCLQTSSRLLRSQPVALAIHRSGPSRIPWGSARVWRTYVQYDFVLRTIMRMDRALIFLAAISQLLGPRSP